MATFDVIRPTAKFTLFRDMINSVVAWNDERQTRKALSGLTDRELSDIGLIRADIDGVARNI